MAIEAAIHIACIGRLHHGLARKHAAHTHRTAARRTMLLAQALSHGCEQGVVRDLRKVINLHALRLLLAAGGGRRS